MSYLRWSPVIVRFFVDKAATLACARFVSSPLIKELLNPSTGRCPTPIDPSTHPPAHACISSSVHRPVPCQPHHAQGELSDRNAEQGNPEVVPAPTLSREPRERDTLGDDRAAVPDQEPRVERALLRA